MGEVSDGEAEIVVLEEGLEEGTGGEKNAEKAV